MNSIKILVSPGLESRFSTCEAKIKHQTKDLKWQIQTAGLEAAQKRGDSILTILKDTAALPNSSSNIFPFRFVQNCPRNNSFFGREECMDELTSLFRAGAFGNPPRTTGVVIHGFGGCGKSSIAKEYMYRHFETGEYAVMLWFHSDTAAKLETQFIQLARKLGVKTNEAEARDAALHWINHLGEYRRESLWAFIPYLKLEKPFLIVFDNADDPSFLPSFWPSSIHGSIIITSRNPTAQEVNLAQHGIHLKAFSEDTGTEFLISILKDRHPLTTDDCDAIESLSRYFGGLPLALRQAGSFMVHKKCSPSQFKRLYQSRFEEIDGYQIAEYDKTVADVWTMSSSALSDDARTILDTLSLLDPDSVPMEIFEVADIEHPHGEFLKDPLRVLDAQEDLANQSLVDHDQASGSLSIHRLFQETTFRKLKKDGMRLQNILHFAVSLIHKFSPEIDLEHIRSPSHWKPIERILSHVQSVYHRCKHAVTEKEAVILLKLMVKVLK